MKGLTRWQKGTTALIAIVFLALTVIQPLIFFSGEAVAAVNASADEATMLQLVNQARNNAGLPSLYVEQRLTDMARSYSNEMIQYDFFGHVSPVSGTLQQRVAAWGLTGWTLGTTPLTMARAERHGTTDSVDVVEAGPGASAATYTIAANGGEGNAIMWVWDSAVDCSEADNGHPNWGPKWGITNPLYQSLYACINRASYVAYSKGYEVASSVSPYSVIWYNWQARPVDQQPAGHPPPVCR